MSTTATLKPGNKLWGHFFNDREYAREIGDPMRTVVEAPTKNAAEDAAMARLRRAVGTSGHGGTSPKRTVASTAEATPVAFASAQKFTLHPHLTMRTPITAQVRTAIEVLNCHVGIAGLVEELNAQNLTVSAAVKHPGFSLLDRQRLQTWQRKLYAEIKSITGLLLPTK